MESKVTKNNFRGCLFGGATADAKGYGIKSGGKELVSDNTQMASFTVDGLVWADDRAKRRGVYAYIPCLFYSYQKWYYTQTGNLADKSYDFILKGEILEWEELFARRGTGETSLTALAGSIGNKYGTIKNRINNSDACGGIVRAAPIGLYFWEDPAMAFRIGMEGAALTHGHTLAILTSGFYAAFIAEIISGLDLRTSAEEALKIMKSQPLHKGYELSSEIITRAIKLAAGGSPIAKCIEEIGQGFTSEEAAAIAVLIVLRYRDDFQSAIAASTGFSGNVHSVPPIVGGALGACLGSSSIPKKWVNSVELPDLLTHGADLLLERVEPVFTE